VPFVTEAIWQRLNEAVPYRGPGAEPPAPLLARAGWPRADAARISPAVEEQFALLQELIRQVRNVRTQHNVPPGRKVDVLAEADGPAAQTLQDNADLLTSQAGVGKMTLCRPPAPPPQDAAAITAGGIKLYVLGIIDRQAERSRLGRQKETLLRGIRGIEAKLANESFLQRAPADLVARERQRLEALRGELAAVEQSLGQLL